MFNKAKTVYPLHEPKDKPQKKPEHINEEEAYFGMMRGFDIAANDQKIAGAKITETIQAINDVKENAKGEIEKSMAAHGKIAENIEDERKALSIIDSTIDETFDKKLTVANERGAVAVRKIAAWLYHDPNCKKHFREYTSAALRHDVAFYLSKAVRSVVEERSPITSYVVNFVTPGFKHYYTDPHLDENKQKDFVNIVDTQCRTVNIKHNIN